MWPLSASLRVAPVTGRDEPFDAHHMTEVNSITNVVAEVCVGA